MIFVVHKVAKLLQRKIIKPRIQSVNMNKNGCTNVNKQTHLYYTSGVTPKRVTSGGDNPRGSAPGLGDTASKFEEISLW